MDQVQEKRWNEIEMELRKQEGELLKAKIRKENAKAALLELEAEAFKKERL